LRDFFKRVRLGGVLAKGAEGERGRSPFREEEKKI